VAGINIDYDVAGAAFRGTAAATVFFMAILCRTNGKLSGIKKIGQKAEYSFERRVAVYDCHLSLWATSTTSSSASNTP
jgi:hypothetical protein